MSVSGAGAAFKCRVLGLLCQVRSSGTACDSLGIHDADLQPFPQPPTIPSSLLGATASMAATAHKRHLCSFLVASAPELEV